MHHIQHPHPTHSGVDMTEGNITGHLIRFALPLLAGTTTSQMPTSSRLSSQRTQVLSSR